MIHIKKWYTHTMNILGKIFALVIFVLMIFIIMNARSILPYISRVSFGSNTASPTDIGMEYINIAEKMAPKVSQVTYSGNMQYSMYATRVASQGYTGSSQAQESKVIADKIGNLVAVTTQNLFIPSELQGRAHIWIVNTPTISDQTSYIDMGVVRNGGVQTYRKDLGTGPDLSLAEYRYIMIINPEDYSIYTQATLTR